MKKSCVFLFFTVFVISLGLSAQTNFDIGLNAGLNYPTIRGYEYARNNNFRIGFLIGASFEYDFGNDLSIKSDFNYERKARLLDITYFNSEAEEIGGEKFRELFDYVNIPVFLKYEFGSSKYFANAGPFVNFLMTNKFKPNYPNEDRLRNSTTERNKIDYGLSLGIGTKISVNEKNDLAIEIRDDYGIIDIGGVPNRLDGTYKTNTIKLVLNWNLGI